MSKLYLFYFTHMALHEFEIITNSEISNHVKRVDFRKNVITVTSKLNIVYILKHVHCISLFDPNVPKLKKRRI